MLSGMGLPPQNLGFPPRPHGWFGFLRVQFFISNVEKVVKWNLIMFYSIKQIKEVPER